MLIIHDQKKIVTNPLHRYRNPKSRRLSWAGYAARIDESGNVYLVLLEKPERKEL